jgi:manganese-dependent inorganic pyrophosphatase
MEHKERNMQKDNCWMLAAILMICGYFVFTSCSSDDDVVKTSEQGAAIRAMLKSLDWGTDTTYVYGHKTPDADAVCSSLGYAKLMRALGYNCKAKVSSATNRETAYIAGEFGFSLPELKSSVVPQTRLILTDHTDYAQCVDGAREAIILQKIDHHVEGDISNSNIPYVRREMIGATCTIIYEMYRELGVRIDDETAKILLAGLLSDTRNLSMTTTQHMDSVAWEALVTQLHLEDKVDEINRKMADAAINYDGMSDSEILLSDYKDYEIDGIYFIYYGEGTQAVAEAIFGPSLRTGVTYSKENLVRKQIVPKIIEILQGGR